MGGVVDYSNSNSEYSIQVIPTTGTFNIAIPQVHRMSGSDITFPILNGNGLEDLKKYWFMCEVSYTT